MLIIDWSSYVCSADLAGDGDALLLAARKLQAALTDHGVVAVRQGAHEVVDAGEARGLHHLGVARFGAAVADVVADGVVEQHGVLGDDANGCAQRALDHTADVLDRKSTRMNSSH